MAVGKNKRLTKGKKGGKKKIVDPFTKKEWYKVSGLYLGSKIKPLFRSRPHPSSRTVWSARLWSPAPPVPSLPLTVSAAASTRSTRLISTVTSPPTVNSGEFSLFFPLIDIIFSLVCEEVQGDACLTNFHGMELTRDKQCSIIKKWQTKIEAHVDCTTTDGYKLRLFCVGFTKRRQNQIKKTTYAQTAQVHAIRKKMMDIMRREVSFTLDLADTDTYLRM